MSEARETSPPTASGQRGNRQTGEEQQQGQPARAPRTATVDLPFVTAHFRVPDVPAVRELTRACCSGTSARVPKRLAFYAGLGAAAAVEVIGWPVAVAVGAGTEMVTRVVGRKETASAPERSGQPAQAEAGQASTTCSTAAEGHAQRGSQDPEPWPEYDQQNVDEITRRLAEAGPQVARAVADYEARYKNRSTVLTEADRRAR